MPIDRNTIDQKPRVFISYARADGEQFATDLRNRLIQEHIPLWQDRIGMEGGRDWWQQITEALDQVEFMVLVMTPAVMHSPTVRKEWRYARQQGVCVYPVKATPNLDFASLPHWMRSAHFYTLEHEWQKFVNDLNTRCEQTRVLFMVEDLPPDFVPRPAEFSQLIGKLLDEKREEPVAITAALRGAGGYGKTTMAKALCHDERIQQAFDDGILWVTLGENPGNLVSKLEDLIFMLTRDKPGFSSIETATAYFAEKLAERDILLVIDDVWNATHLRPFMQGGTHCARLITTRNEDVLPPFAQSIPVDAMQQQEALALLAAGLGDVPPSSALYNELRTLSGRLGEWPLLLKLANGRLRKQVGRGQLLADVLVYLNKALKKHGLVAFDEKNPQERQQAVQATLQVSFELLSKDEYVRYRELAIFPEDVNIPLVTVERLWAKTGGLDTFETEELCSRLVDLSLLLSFDPVKHTIRLHDVIRLYLQQELGAHLSELHAHLLDAFACPRWATLSQDEPYLWDHLVTHLMGAGHTGELVATVKDLRYLATKTWMRGAYSVEIDLIEAEQYVPEDRQLSLLKRHFVNMEHILAACDTLNTIANALLSRLRHLEELSLACNSFAQELPRPHLLPWYPLPDLPYPSLIRTLGGHTGGVIGCAISADGSFIVSASSDRTLKVWDTKTGQERFTLVGHRDEVTGCAISADGSMIVSASSDRTLKVWDTKTGQERLSLVGHRSKVTGCAISADGSFIVSASADKALKVWDTKTGQERFTLVGHTSGVRGCAISAGGSIIVSATYDLTLKIWDVRIRQERLSLISHSRWVRGCAISTDGSIVVSASDDKTLKVWDAHTGEERLSLTGHSDRVKGCAISADSTFIVSASWDKTLKVWDAHTGQEKLSCVGHNDYLTGCIISPDSTFIVSTSWDKTLKIWNAHTGQECLSLIGHRDRVRGCAISADGSFIVSASYDHTLKIWNAHTGQERLSLTGHSDRVKGCAISADSTFIVSASWDKTLKVWDTKTGHERLSLVGHKDWINSCAMSPDGTLIVSVSDDRTLKVWETQSGVCLFTFPVEGTLEACAFHPDGKHIVAVGGKGVYFLKWEL